jgi:RNA polymerase sigma-70 factor (ECF subfamily)
MKTLNLRDYYPSLYTSDCFIEVSDEVDDIFITSKRNEAAYHSRKYYNKAQYSLDRDDGIERHILNSVPSAEDGYERALTTKLILAAIDALPDKQARRVYAHYFLGMSKPAIAKAEGVNVQVVRKSIQRGLQNIGHFLKKSL